MIAIKVLALTSAAGISIAQTIPIEAGEKFGNLGASAILGVVCLACVYALVKLYRDKENDITEARKCHNANAERLYEMIEENTKASQQHADSVKEMAGVLVEVKNAVVTCRSSNQG